MNLDKGSNSSGPGEKLSDHEWALLWGIARGASRQGYRHLADGRLLLKLERQRYISRAHLVRRHKGVALERGMGVGTWPKSWTRFYLLTRGMRALGVQHCTTVRIYSGAGCISTQVAKPTGLKHGN